jgi:hypothetical protein
LTQVFGGLLGGGHRSSSSSNIPSFAEGSTGGTLFSDNAAISHRASRDFELGKLLIDGDDGDDTRTTIFNDKDHNSKTMEEDIEQSFQSPLYLPE